MRGHVRSEINAGIRPGVGMTGRARETDRIGRVEDRVGQLEAAMTAESVARIGELARQAETLAVVREGQRIFEDLITRSHDTQERIAADVGAVRSMLVEHVLKEGRDKTQMLVGVVTAALSALGTLALVGWGVYQVIERMT